MRGKSRDHGSIGDIGSYRYYYYCGGQKFMREGKERKESRYESAGR